MTPGSKSIHEYIQTSAQGCTSQYPFSILPLVKLFFEAYSLVALTILVSFLMSRSEEGEQKPQKTIIPDRRISNVGKRSPKAVEKKERKLGKSKANETVYEPHDGFADWRKTPSVNNPRNGVSRNLTVSSRTTSRSSSTNDSGSRPRLNTLYSNSSSDVRPAQSLGGGSPSVSDVSTRGKDTPKFQANGKETKAPRGRGGGVPVKKPIASSPALPNSRAESTAFYPSSSQKTWLNFKTWKAGKDGMRPYGGFEYVSVLQSQIITFHLIWHTRTRI
jgi:hypothetical protein